MRPKDIARAQEMTESLERFAREVHPLPGMRDAAHRDALVGQLIESVRRIEYVRLIAKKQHGAERADPTSELFDPLRAAIIAKHAGDFEEACWLVFLSTHCGKNLHSGWRLARLIYSGGGQPWTWTRISTGVATFRDWLGSHQRYLKPDGRCGFGNHRKYESLDARSKNGTARVIASYVAWVCPYGNHAGRIERSIREAGNNPHRAFDNLYGSMNTVMRFGRMAKFDYLTMLGKMGLAEIEPGIPYMKAATGPARGARLLFGGKLNARLSGRELEDLTVRLGREVNVGMQVMEDAICNWQKCPGRFRAFRG